MDAESRCDASHTTRCAITAGHNSALQAAGAARYRPDSTRAVITPDDSVVRDGEP